MTASKTKTGTKAENGPLIETRTIPTDVLTLDEAATYLRITTTEILRMVKEQDLPGRLIGQQWRFLKSALQDWLRTPCLQSGKEAVLARIGSWQDDPYLHQELEEIHKQRGRPVIGDEK